MAEIDVFKAQLVRPDPSTPWGFRLHRGGPDNQLTIFRLAPGSPAARIGLKSGDALTEIMNRSTRHMGERDAMNMLNQSQTSILLTVERRVGESEVPEPQSPQAASPESEPYYSEPNSFPYNHTQPPETYSVPEAQPDPVGYYMATAVPAYQPPDQPIKGYQTYDMTGKPTQQGWTGVAHHHPSNVQLHQAQSRPFDKPKNPYASPPQPSPQPPPQPHQEAVNSASFSPPHQPDHVHLIPEEDKLDLDMHQSRTFKIIESIMQNNEPTGPSGLPPQRSATLERVRAEERARREGKAPSSPRVQVLMAQQYNNPMGLYHPKNVMETFATQANACMEDLERRAAREEAEAQPFAQQAIQGHAYNGT